jgi:soluble lytic murein transglycosylase-like protein
LTPVARILSTTPPDDLRTHSRAAFLFLRRCQPIARAAPLAEQTKMRHPLLKPALALALASLSMRPCGVRAEAPDCFAAAALYQHVNPTVLRAIAWQESHGNANAVHRNHNGSTDYGMMQINSVHLAQLSRYGVSATDLMNPCSSIFVAAWHLHKMMIKYGNTWAAIGAYHSESPAERDRYARSIEGIVDRVSASNSGEQR